MLVSVVFCKPVQKCSRTREDLFLSVLNPHLSTNSLVLRGSWSGHKDEQVLPGAFGGKDVDLKIIPPKTTKYAQPVDVYFFRQHKIYAKRITDFIKLRSSNMQPKLHDRFFIIEIAFCHLQSIICRSIQTNASLRMAECWLRYWRTCG